MESVSTDCYPEGASKYVSKRMRGGEEGDKVPGSARLTEKQKQAQE